MIGEALRRKGEKTRVLNKNSRSIRNGIIGIFTYDLKTGTSIQGCVWMWIHHKDLPRYTNPYNEINNVLANEHLAVVTWFVLSPVLNLGLYKMQPVCRRRCYKQCRWWLAFAPNLSNVWVCKGKSCSMTCGLDVSKNSIWQVVVIGVFYILEKGRESWSLSNKAVASFSAQELQHNLMAEIEKCKERREIRALFALSKTSLQLTQCSKCPSNNHKVTAGLRLGIITMM